jgi:hypothetical protein
MEGDRFILGEDVNVADIRIETIGKGEVDESVNGTKRYRRFSPIPGEGIEPFSPTPC